MNESIDSLRQQLQQLQAQLTSGVLTPQQYDTDKAALERRLLDQVLTQSPQDNNARLVFAGIAALALVVAGAGYWASARRVPASPAVMAHAGVTSPGAATMGATSMPSTTPSMPVSAPHGTNSDQVVSMTDRLAERLKQQPGDAEGWAMLARSYSVLGRHPEALKAYEKAVALRKDDANLLADYADSLAMQNNRVLAGEPLKLVERALKMDPRNPKALSMAGSEAFDRQDYARAIRYWQQLVDQGPGDSPMVRQILPGLEQARQLAGQTSKSAKLGKP